MRKYPVTHRAFPPELSDAVIDYLAGELIHIRRRALKACSLVSKSWVNRTRFHLFHTVCLDSESVKAFLAILASPLLTLVPFTRQLRIEGGTIEKEGAIEEGDWQTVALPLLRALSAVEVLVIRWINFADLGSNSHDTLSVFTGFQKLKKLQLECCHFGAFQLFAEALSPPCLGEISLERVWMPPMGKEGGTTIAAPAHVKSLELKFPIAKTDILTWLASGTHIPAVETLRLIDIQVCHMPPIANSMRVLGASLKHLEIGLSAKGISHLPSLNLLFLSCLIHVQQILSAISLTGVTPLILPPLRSPTYIPHIIRPKKTTYGVCSAKSHHRM
jgi:hypothetical protein